MKFIVREVSHLQQNPASSSLTNVSHHTFDGPELQKLLVKILAGQLDPRNIDWDAYYKDKDHVFTKPPTTTVVTTTQAEDENLPHNTFNIGLVIPLALVSLAMVVLLICVLRHSCLNRTKRGSATLSNEKRQQSASLFNVHSNFQIWGPNKSTEALNVDGSSKGISPAVITRVRLGSIRESPEDRWRESGYDNESMRREIQAEMSSGVDSSGTFHSHPAVHSFHGQCDATHKSDPEFHPTHHFSPYALKLIKPSLTYSSKSDPGLVKTKYSQRHNLMIATANELARNLTGVPSTCVIHQQNIVEVHHPQDVSQESKSESLINNHASSLYAPSPSPDASQTSAIITPGMIANVPVENVMLRASVSEQIQAIESNQRRISVQSGGSNPGNLNGSHGSNGTCVSVQLSCPSSVGSWQYNDLYSQPAGNAQPIKNLLTKALLNSANRPTVANAGQVLDPNQFLNMQQQVASIQPANISMQPNIGSSDNSFSNQPPASANTSANHIPPFGNQSSLGMTGQVLSTIHGNNSNTSVCANMDSCETSDNYTVGTTNNTSDHGYAAGPSHSTSIDRNNIFMSDNIDNHTQLSSLVSETVASSCSTSSIQGISSIGNATLNSDLMGSAFGGQQIFHQAMSMDQGSGSITLSFASTAKSAPPAMQYGGTGVQPAKSLYELHQQQLMQNAQNLVEMRPLSSGAYTYSSGSSTPTPGTGIAELHQGYRPNTSLQLSSSMSAQQNNSSLMNQPCNSTPESSANQAILNLQLARLQTARAATKAKWSVTSDSGVMTARTGEAESVTPTLGGGGGGGRNVLVDMSSSSLHENQVHVILPANMVTGNESTFGSPSSATAQAHRRKSNQPLLSQERYWV